LLADEFVIEKVQTEDPDKLAAAIAVVFGAGSPFGSS